MYGFCIHFDTQDLTRTTIATPAAVRGIDDVESLKTDRLVTLLALPYRRRVWAPVSLLFTLLEHRATVLLRRAAQQQGG